ncbi:sugar ABC transporter permease [Evansella sp. LMS18]|jgi:multiple sugar transport system permease protein|uniref:carbohydrate ABC transporter permease n=1 Tax=Evansella sp. LMS18 TaxID=2924033 RepID=UPI0020D01BC2|nr:sugar ABC transporter permease [Evansella sp. LMS18]UTR12680.1 sugar ABC transporter permease [Evansella sp. LMS18]
MRKKDNLTGFLFILPALIVLLTVVFYPLLWTFWLSFQEKILIAPQRDGFIGVEHYQGIFQSDVFWRFLGITLIFTLSSVAIKIIFGLVGALLLNKNHPGTNVYWSILVIPWLIPSVVGALIWRWMLHEQFGIINRVFVHLGVLESAVPWLSREFTALLSVIIVDAWVGLPFMIIVFLAGLKTIPSTLYEAAKVDGAGFFQQLRFVTIPGLKSVLLVMGTLSLIGTFNSFNIIYAMTGGGPVNATNTLVIHIYRTAFTQYNFGLASALAVVTFIIISCFVIFYIRQLDKEGEM